MTLGVLLTYSVVLALFYRTTVVLSYSTVLENFYYMIVLLIGAALTTLGYFYIFKQELYRIYEGDHIRRGTVYTFHPILLSSNISMKILLLEYVRCKEFRKFLTSMCIYIIAGIACYISFDLKPLALGLLLGIYTMNMLQFTISLSSDYFEGLYTKPISIKSLLVSAFYIHVIATTFIFLILLIFILIFDKQFILPLVSLYVYMLGTIAFFLLHNVLFARKFNLFPIQSDLKIQRTFDQQVIGFITGISLYGGAFIIHFFPTIGSYVIIENLRKP